MDQIPQQVHAQTDVGLKNFMLGTYRYMMMAMAVTASVAYFFGQYLVANEALARTLTSPWIALGMIVGIMFAFGGVGAKLHTMSKGGVVTFLFAFAAVMGIFMSLIGLFYKPEVIAKIFFMTVALFGALSVFGHTTERDLGTYAKYAIAAFAAYVGINLLGMFFPALRPEGMLDMVITGVALLAISFIVAWETQMLKRIYYSFAGNAAMLGKLSAYGAASLLLAFINMFQILLSLFGNE